MQPSRSSGLGVAVLLLPLALGAGAAGGWMWARWSARPPPQEGALSVPSDRAIGHEGLLTGTRGWQIVRGGEVLPDGGEAVPSTPQAPSSPPRERARAREPGSRMSKAYLGVRGTTFQRGGLQGVKILEVFPNSPAAKAGLRPEAAPHPGQAKNARDSTAHIIVNVNGQDVRSEDDLVRAVELSAPGEVMQVTVTTADGGSREAILVVLDDAPEPSATGQRRGAKRR